jgi:hypothetical protein
MVIPMTNDILSIQRPSTQPMIYAYEDKSERYQGLLKVGYTASDVDKRVAQQYPTLRPGGLPYRIVFRESAIRKDGTVFTDREVHLALRRRHVRHAEGEWFRCTPEQLRAAWLAVRDRQDNVEDRSQDFALRPEQREAVEKTAAYFQSVYQEGSFRTPKFLWNAKMRFGKTFTAYQLSRRMGMKRVLVLTFKPAVESTWREDLVTHIDFEGWQFISRGGLTYEEADQRKPILCFGSFQDFLGYDRATGGIKPRNEWVHSINWDMVIFDEYHFGAWTETAQQLFKAEDDDEYDKQDLEHYNRGNAYDETWLPITAKHYLYLSGTPFRALNSGEFIEEQIYSWTYSDEQRAKQNWTGPDNPYAALPRMVMLTYRIPDSIRHVAMKEEFDSFDLNIFFSTKGDGDKARFVYEDEVQKWLNLIRGSYLETTVDELKLGAEKPPMPFADTRLLSVLNHTFWFLPGVANCYAMRNLLRQRQNTFYHDYHVNVCAGLSAGIGMDALAPVLKSMDDPLNSKSITLSCGKLTTGVTVRPWTGIFMLRNLSSPETYFQAAFRVQNPWEVTGDEGKKEIIKQQCYVFDFALDRALRQISDYSRQINTQESNPENKVAEFINFLPVLAYDGSSMRQVNAAEILDITMAGTTATLLAKRWESALLVNVDNDTLKRLMANEAAMKALMSIEGFRSLNADIETIINKSEAVKKARKDSDAPLTEKQKKVLTEAEKEYKSKRKMIQEKLIKFATRVPVFMYLTDYREYSLEDVIKQLEPGLFKAVTGLNVADFDLLMSLGVFNKSLMNDAVYKFRRYEDSSLSYTGINRHAGENIGLFDTVMSYQDYMDTLQRQQKASMTAEPRKEEDIPVNPFFGLTAQPDDDDEHEEPVIAKGKQKSVINESVIPATPAVKVPVSTRQPEKPVPIKTQITPPVQNPAYKPNPTAVPKPAVRIDTSEIKSGTLVRHKAFGQGQVTLVKDGYIHVQFGPLNKEFQFPGAFLNGFLAVDM